MKISIITVCYNSEKTIAHTLRSVQEQSFKNVEYIVVDGGSSDSTLDIISKQGRHVAKQVSGPDKGIYDAMNKGIAMASGDVIGFINSDDYYESSEVLSKVVQAFDDLSVDACYGDLCYVAKNDINKVVRYWKAAEFKSKSFESGVYPPHPTFFARRAIYDRFGGFNIDFKLAADAELMMRFLEVQKIHAKYIPEVLVRMRMGGASNRSITNIFKQNKEILMALKSHGLRSSLLSLLGHKLMSRGIQFFTRP